jgi:hypothetical protein
MAELTILRTVYQIAVSLMKWELANSFLLSTAFDVFLMTVTAENPVWHKCTVTMESKSLTASSHELGQSSLKSSQN